MKTSALICIALTLILATVSPGLSAGKIVLSDDDWTLSDSAFGAPNDPGVFAANVASWFTGGSAGSFLAYSYNFGLTGTQLRNAMVSAGHSWTPTTVGAFDLARLSGYDGVFLSVACTNGISADVLTQYVNTGGNVYLHAGAGSVAMWNTFLANFGLAFGTTYNPLVESTAINSSHPILAGVDHLYRYNGNDIIDLDPQSDLNHVLAYSGAHGIIGIYDGSLVPEPSSLLALGGGLIGLGGIIRRRRD